MRYLLHSAHAQNLMYTRMHMQSPTDYMYRYYTASEEGCYIDIAYTLVLYILLQHAQFKVQEGQLECLKINESNVSINYDLNFPVRFKIVSHQASPPPH
jgi:hypothetical protein